MAVDVECGRGTSSVHLGHPAHEDDDSSSGDNRCLPRLLRPIGIGNGKLGSVKDAVNDGLQEGLAAYGGVHSGKDVKNQGIDFDAEFPMAFRFVILGIKQEAAVDDVAPEVLKEEIKRDPKLAAEIAEGVPEVVS